MRCMLCGRDVSSGGVTMRSGVSLCNAHMYHPLCLWCGKPALGSNAVRPVCVGCRRTMIYDKEQASVHVTSLMLLISDLGVADFNYELNFRTDSEAWGQGFLPIQDPHVLGYTTFGETPHATPTVEVALGVPEVEFMAVLAHEFGHAILAPYEAARELPLRVQEGFSEVLGEVFAATSQDTYAVRRHRAQLRERTDPVYGRGYAEVSARTQTIGLKAVFEEVKSARW
jgi:hypothetical protein